MQVLENGDLTIYTYTIYIDTFGCVFVVVDWILSTIIIRVADPGPCVFVGSGSGF